MGEIAAALGLAYARAGRVDDAMPVLEFALNETATIGLRFTYREMGISYRVEKAEAEMRELAMRTDL